MGSSTNPRNIRPQRWRKGLRIPSPPAPPPPPVFDPGPYSTWYATWLGSPTFGPSASFNQATQTNVGDIVAVTYNPGVYSLPILAITAGLNPTATFDNTYNGGIAFATLVNGGSYKTSAKGTGLAGVFNKPITISGIAGNTAVITGIDTTGETYVYDPTPNFDNVFKITLNITVNIREFLLTDANIAAKLPLVSGRYELRDANINLLTFTNSTGPTSRIPIRLRNVTIQNENRNADVQLVNPFTGHLEYNGCDVDAADVLVDYACGGINSYSAVLAGGGSTDGVIVAQGAGITISDSTGTFNNFYNKNSAYDGFKLNGQNEHFSFKHFSHHRHDALVGGGHSDGWQITALDNSTIGGDGLTWQYGWFESGGNACIYLNDFQGDNIHRIKNCIADSCIFFSGNKGLLSASSRLSGVRNSFFPDDTGAPDPHGFNTINTPHDVGSGDTTHGDAEFPIFQNNVRYHNDGTKVVLNPLQRPAPWTNATSLPAFPL